MKTHTHGNQRSSAVRLSFIAVVLFFWMAGCDGGAGLVGVAPAPALSVPQVATSTPLAMQTLGLASSLDVSEAGAYAFKTDAPWHDFWMTYRQENGEKPLPAPAFDFGSWMVLVVALGAQSGCSNEAFLIQSVLETETEVQVLLQRNRPETLQDGANGKCMEVVYPVQLVLVEQTVLPVVFKEATPL